MGRTLRVKFQGKRKVIKIKRILFSVSPLAIILFALYKWIDLGLNCPRTKYGWVATNGCYGLSRPTRDKPSFRSSCENVAPSKESGFCLCDEVIISAPLGCVHTPIRCDIYCLQTDVIRGSPRHSCKKEIQSKKEPSSLHFSPIKKGIHPYFRSLFQIFHTKIRNRIPGDRRNEIDYLVLNKRIKRESVSFIKSHMDRFLKDSTSVLYNSSYFPKKKGIVIVGGSGKKYRTAYWVCIHSIRRTNSILPIELWFREEELPRKDKLRVLEKELNVKVRSFDEIWGSTLIKDKASGYELKIYAIFFSSFNEVLFLDADNVAVTDVDALFSEASYEQHGSLFWQDYWYSSADPSCSDIFGRSSIVKVTHESGQMILHKGKIWPALVLALYMTYNAETFYPLTSGFLGYGDKEILPFALRKLNFSYGLIDSGPDHVGVFGKNGDANTSEIYGNTMLQFNSLGEPAFLHANLGKWTTHVPARSANYVRRWQASILYGVNIVNVIEKNAGVDLEMWIYRLILENACFFDHSAPAHWFEKIGIGPLVEGVYLHLFPQKNLDLEIFNRYRSV